MNRRNVHADSTKTWRFMRVEKVAMTTEEAFGHVVQELRRARNLTQDELAIRSGLHRTYISLVERGLRSPKLNTIFRLAAVLDTSPEDLLKRTSAMLVPDAQLLASEDLV
jgi:transcriptional regulator with XRE-family HTH domain